MPLIHNATINEFIVTASMFLCLIRDRLEGEEKDNVALYGKEKRKQMSCCKKKEKPPTTTTTLRRRRLFIFFSFFSFSDEQVGACALSFQAHHHHCIPFKQTTRGKKRRTNMM